MLNAILRKLGFHKVFESAFGVDVEINELAAELMDRIEKDENLPRLFQVTVRLG